MDILVRSNRNDDQKWQENLQRVHFLRELHKAKQLYCTCFNFMKHVTEENKKPTECFFFLNVSKVVSGMPPYGHLVDMITTLLRPLFSVPAKCGLFFRRCI